MYCEMKLGNKHQTIFHFTTIDGEHKILSVCELNLYLHLFSLMILRVLLNQKAASQLRLHILAARHQALFKDVSI